MNKRVVVCLAWACILAGIAQAEPAPALLHYNEAADAACTTARGYEIKSDWQAELRQRLPELQALWAAEAPRLFAAAERLTGRPFSSAGQRVRLSLCDLPSHSIGEITVNMRYALRSFTADPVPLRAKLDTVFHELLHGPLASDPATSSALLASHAGQPPCVRNHLHLLALQKAVLLSLGQAEELAQVVRIDSQLPSGCYKRAWAIVNDTDATYQAYVAELARH